MRLCQDRNSLFYRPNRRLLLGAPNPIAKIQKGRLLIKKKMCPFLDEMSLDAALLVHQSRLKKDMSFS